MHLTLASNSQLVVDEDDLKWVANEKNILLLLKQFYENCLRVLRAILKG